MLKSKIAPPIMNFLEGLNPQQQEAVCHLEGPLLILAGAGSGKTRVVTHRIARLIAVAGVSPRQILAVTFTNKAAGEMRERVARLLASCGRPAADPWVSTFHSFAVRLLRQDGAALADLRPGFTPKFTIYDEDAQASVLKAVHRKLGLDEKTLPHRAALAAISRAKSSGRTPQDVYKLATGPKDSQLAVVYEEYEGSLRQANALDFDDLLLEAVRLLRHDGRVRGAYNERFVHLMIDEYQDTNRSQYELVRLLTELRQNVCAVGDEDQSIYGWRGAEIRNILDFERDYPSARVIRLEQNYRSTKPILEAASALVSHNSQRRGKWLWTAESGGVPVGMFEAEDGEQEALFVGDQIQRLRWEDPAVRIAVLYRTNAQSRQFEEAFRRYSIPYLVVGGFSFYQRAEVRDALSYLRALQSPQDSVSLMRILNTPARGIGKTTAEQIERFAREHSLSAWQAIQEMLAQRLFPVRAQAALGAFRNLVEELRREMESLSLEGLLRLVLSRTGYLEMLEADQSPGSEARVENLKELLSAAAEAGLRGDDLSGFLDHAALVSDADQIDERAAVSLLTLHNAKGMEFPVVFMAGMEEGLCPHSRSFDSEDMIEEERRLCYVGMTRAQKRLTLSWARLRRRFGGGSPEPAMPSRFLREIPRKLTVDLSAHPPAAELDLFAERAMAREAVQRTAYTGKTYDSLEQVRQFFAARGKAAPAARAAGQAPAAASRRKRESPVGAVVVHPRFGRGTVLRREGEGEEAKLTVSFPGHGLKKIIQKYSGLKTDA